MADAPEDSETPIDAADDATSGATAGAADDHSEGEASNPESQLVPGPGSSKPASDGADNFASMLEESNASGRDVKVGEKISGVLAKIGPETSFVDFGGRSEGVIKTSELRAATASPAALEQGRELRFNEGDPLEAFVVAAGEEIVLSRLLGREDGNADLLYQAFKSKIPVEGKVCAVNKWGLGIEIQGVRAFCPVSQIDTQYVKDTAAYRDETMTFLITEFRNQGRNIVVSRRALLQADRDQEAEAVRAKVVKGAELEGTVTRLEPFGVFVDLGGGVEGLIHVSELSHTHVEHPSEVLQQGGQVKVSVLRVKSIGNKKSERISLSIKALEKDPWLETSSRFTPGSVVKGKVDAMEDYGAFVELDENVRGMVHVSEMSDKRIGHPKDVVSVGDEVTVAVLELDSRRRRLRLSMKQVETLEDAANLREFQDRQKQDKKNEPSSTGNALTDALKRAQLID